MNKLWHILRERQYEQAYLEKELARVTKEIANIKESLSHQVRAE